jgi:hypothetical protein
MKRNRTIIGLLLVLLIAGNACHSGRHDRRDMRDSAKMIWMKMGQNFRHKRGMPVMQGMMHHGMRNGMMRGIGPGMGFGMMRGMGRMPMDSIGWMPMAPGRRMLESIPNVTENQKKQIADLNKKQIDEMKKVREEMFSKMQGIMDSHRKDILNILTDEQKKFLESRRAKPSVSPEKAK